MRLIRVLFLTLSLVLVLQAREQVNVSFSDLELNDFIKVISNITKKNILVNHPLTGQVNFVSTSPIYEDELMEILVSVLESKGFTLVPNGSMYEVVRSTEAAQHNVRVAGQNKKLYGSLMVTQDIEVTSNNVDAVAAKIRHLISKSAKLVTMKESNVLLITDYPNNIETIKKVIKKIDTDNQAIVKIIPITKAAAKSIQVKLADIALSLFNETVETQKVKVILDENSNGIIIVGIEKNVAIVEALIKKLDVESNVSTGVRIFSLKNSDAKTVLASLNEIISKQVFANPELKPNVSMNEEINAIIAIGEPNIIKGIKLIIDELDREKYQVYVQARIIEINKNDSEAIGVKYGFAAGDVSSSGLYAMSANFGDQALTTLASAQVLDYLGGLGGTASGLALGATLDFLQTKGASKSVSNPSILCVNNMESSIYVGKTISILNGTTSNAVSGITNDFKREEVGLTLKIKPRVSSVDKVTLDVTTILENVIDDGTNNASGQPVTSKQEVKTQTILRHGEDIIIGGLVKSYEVESRSQIPILGDIPWLGDWLFSSNSTRNEKDNLIVILTPYVIETSENLSQLQKNLGELSNIQKEYNEKVFAKIEAKAQDGEQAPSLFDINDTKKGL